MIIQNNQNNPSAKNCLIGVEKLRLGPLSQPYPILGSETYILFKNGETPVLDFGGVTLNVSKRLCMLTSSEQGSHSHSTPFTNDPIQNFGTLDTVVKPTAYPHTLLGPTASAHHEVFFIVFPDHITEGAISAKGYIDSIQSANKAQAANKREENLLKIFFPVKQKQNR